MTLIVLQGQFNETHIANVFDHDAPEKVSVATGVSAQDAAQKAVRKFYQDNRPSILSEPVKTEPHTNNAEWRHGLLQVRDVVSDAINLQADIEIEYVDALGDRTLRVVQPQSAGGDRFNGYDPNRDGLRTFVFNRVVRARPA